MPPEWLGGEIAVVGLARSGRAAAQLARSRRGPESMHRTSARRRSSRRRPPTLRADGVAVDLGRPRSRAHRARVARRRKSGRAARRAAVRRGAGGGRRHRERDRDRAALPARARLHRHHRHERQDDDDRADRPSADEPRSPRGRQPATSGRRSPSWRCRRTPPAWVALEVSSFQLHDTPSIDPRVGVLTNLSANHLDRYDSVDEYFGDKALMFRNAGPGIELGHERRRCRRPGDDAATCRDCTAVSRCGSAATRIFDRRTAELVVLGHPLIRRERAVAARRPQRGERAGRVARRDAGRPRARTPPRLERSRDGARVVHGARASHRDRRGRSTASRGSTIPSRRTSRRRWSRCEGMTRPTVLLLGGKHKGEPYTELGPRACSARVVR